MTMVSGTSEAMIPPGAKCRTLLHLARLTTSSMPSAEGRSCAYRTAVTDSHRQGGAGALMETGGSCYPAAARVP